MPTVSHSIQGSFLYCWTETLQEAHPNKQPGMGRIKSNDEDFKTTDKRG